MKRHSRTGLRVGTGLVDRLARIVYYFDTGYSVRKLKNRGLWNKLDNLEVGSSSVSIYYFVPHLVRCTRAPSQFSNGLIRTKLDVYRSLPFIAMRSNMSPLPPCLHVQ